MFISVNKTRLQDFSTTSNQIKGNVERIRSEFYNVGSSLDWDVKAELNIDRIISQINNEVSKYVTTLNKYQTFFSDAFTKYTQLDKAEIAESALGQNVISFIAGKINPIIFTLLKWFNVKSDTNAVNTPTYNAKVDLMTKEASLKGSSKYGVYNKTKTIQEQTDIPYKQYAYDQITGQTMIYKMAPKSAKKEATILEGKVEGKIEGSLINANVSGKNSWGEGSINAKVGTAEAHASLTGGLYVFDKNGKKTLAPSVNAEIGGSISLLTLAASGKVGNEMLGGYGSLDVDVGKLEAKGVANASFFNEKGELEIQANAKASAEAIAFRAKGRAGVTVLGADIGVSGSVTVGVGAHAEIGIVDGVVKVDIGASLGLGVSVGFDVDVGGTVDAVCSGAKAAWTAFTSWF